MSALDKKIKTLREALPRLDDEEARRLLEKAGGSINKASDMALEDGEWTSAAAKKKPAPKKSDKAAAAAAPARREDNKDRPRRDFADRKPRFEEPKVAKKQEVAATPASIVVGGSKSKVETGISFADMIKRQKQAEQPAEVAPAPQVDETPVEVAVVAEEPEAPAAPVAEVPKPKREKKEPKKKAAPLPQKYEAEIDRLATVNFPLNIVELASGAFTFSSEPGRAPTPPRQVQPVHQQPAAQQPVNDWSHNAPRHQQQPVQRTWNQDAGNNYNNNRNQHFAGEWRQSQPRNYEGNNMGYNNNHRMNQGQYRDSYNNANSTNNHVARPHQGAPQPPQNNFW